MLTYNTRLKKLVLPEYGRNIQKMVDYCMSIEDRDLRNACANSIIETMAHLFPSDGDQEDYRTKLWDHLAIMSDFKLDIDWPEGVIQKEELNTQPQPIENIPYDIQHRQYGRNLEQMIEVASKMEDSPEREALILLLANHMKKMALVNNPEGVDDSRIIREMRAMSHGAINLNPNDTFLYEYMAMPVSKKKKKK